MLPPHKTTNWRVLSEVATRANTGSFVMPECYANRVSACSHEENGWEGIRTPGALRHTRFPGVHNRPLCHPSLELRSWTAATETRLKLQSTEQFVERELQADVEFAEFAVIGADRIEAHLVNDRFNLKRVLRE